MCGGPADGMTLVLPGLLDPFLLPALESTAELYADNPTGPVRLTVAVYTVVFDPATGRPAANRHGCVRYTYQGQR
jgi:hypothetical protein